MQLRSALFSLLLLTGVLSAQTYVSGSISGLWGYDYQPYILTGDAVVASGDTLRIDANVIVDLGAQFELRVQGVLMASGVQWGNGGALFGAGGELSLENCRFEGLTGGIKIFGGSAHINACSINNTAETGITFNGTDSSGLFNSSISNSGDYGVKIRASDDVEIIRNTFTGNSRNDLNHPALFIDSASPETIEHNIIQDNHAQGVGIWSLSSMAHAFLRNNIIRRNFTGVTLVNAPCFLENNIIVANFVTGNSNSGAGVYSGYSNSTPILMSNYIAGNYYGVSNINSAQCNLGDLINDYPGDDGLNIFYNNMVGGEVWNIWNSTALQLLAQNNYWPGLDLEDVDATLWDNEEGGAEILYQPISPLALPRMADINNDTVLNVLDIVIIVENIVSGDVPPSMVFFLADINNDYELDVNDIIALVAEIVAD